MASYGSGGYSQQLYGGGGGGYGGGDRYGGGGYGGGGYGGGGYGGGGYGHAGRHDRYEQPVGGYGQHGSRTHDIPTDVRDCFNRFDTNGSGKMDYRELRNCLVALGGVDISHQGAADILLRYDRDGNGVLDVEEFSVIVKRLREYFTGQSYGGGAENRQIRGNISYEVRSVFEKFDENRSGKLDYRQLGSALRSMGMSADSNQAADIIKKFDTDNNGLMELDEFNTLVWKLRETLYPQHVHGLRVALYILNTPGRVGASERRQHFGAPAQYQYGRDGAARDEFERQSGSARAYISEQQLEMVLSSAISQAVHERATDGKARIAELLTGARHSAAVGVGSASTAQRLQEAEARAAEAERRLKEVEADERRYGDDRRLPGDRRLDGDRRLPQDSQRPSSEHERELRNLRETHQVEIAKLHAKLSEAEADRDRDRRETKIGDLGDSRREGNEVARLRDEVRDLKAQLKKGRAYENMINKAVPQNVREGFMEVDKDGSGDIDAKELKKALAKIGLKGDTSQAKSVIEKFDKAGNGSLNLVEFQNLVKELQSMSSMGMLGTKAPAPAPARSGGLGGYGR